MKKLLNKILKFKKKRVLDISFQETMDLCDLPIITFRNNGKKVNFMLDTGSSISILESEIAKELDKEFSGDLSTILSISNERLPGEGYEITFTYRDYTFTDVFYVADIGKAFEKVKEKKGIHIHGLLGTDFFKKYNYVLDFDELKAYIKK